jgi:outer membrane protein TolC
MAGIAEAQTPPPDTNLTLTAAVAQALRDNPDVNSLRARSDAMRERPAQAVALPNPMFTYSGMDMARGGTWPDTGDKYYMLQQDVPWFGKRGLREGMAVKDAEVMQGELDSMTREVTMMVKEAYYDLYAVQRVLTIARDEEAVLGRIVQVTRTMYGTGERSQTDVLKAQAEVTMLKQKLLETEVQESTLKSKLNTLLNRRADHTVGEVAAPPEPTAGSGREDRFTLAAAHRPEVKAAQSQIERYKLEKRLMEKESVPDYQLGVEYRDIGAGDDMVMFTVSVDLPVWRSKYRAGVREAELMRISSEEALAAAESRSALDVQDASFKLQTARRAQALYRNELLPQAEARFQASEAGYRAGQVDFMDLLESERFLLDARIMAAMADGAVGMQAARLERAMGLTLAAEQSERNGKEEE